MNTIKLTSKEYFRTLTIIHIALVAGLITCSLITLLLLAVFMEKEIVVNSTLVLIYVIPLILFGGIALSILLFKRRMESLAQIRDLKEKMSGYRGCLILKYALVEGPALLSILSALITHSVVFLFFALLSIGLLIYWRPTKASVINNLRLKQYEIDIIEKPDSVIAESEIATD